jgi:hypothetical protein
MAFGVGPVLDLPFTAAADLSAKQYHIVEMTADMTVNVCNNAADKPIGILQNKPRAGETAIVRMLGISKVVADGTLNRDDNYGTSADGHAVAKTVADDLILGRVLEGVSNAGEIATVTVNALSLAKV